MSAVPVEPLLRLMVLRIPMRGYEIVALLAPMIDNLVTNPHEGL